MTGLQQPPLVVVSHTGGDTTRAAQAARVLSVPLLVNLAIKDLKDTPFALLYDAEGVSLCHTGRKAPGPVRVDFLSGTQAHRRRFGGGKGQMIARAVGIKAGVFPSILDLTAGLGADGFVLATLGARVHWLERSPVVFRLLEDGLRRAKQQLEVEPDEELAAILARLTLSEGDAITYLEALLAKGDRVDVIYLDPMFPERTKSADVKKEMQAFHQLVGRDEDADQLLARALEAVRYRVIVKRPRKAPALGGVAPSHRIEGKTSRFDVYTRERLPDSL